MCSTLCINFMSNLWTSFFDINDGQESGLSTSWPKKMTWNDPVTGSVLQLLRCAHAFCSCNLIKRKTEEKRQKQREWQDHMPVHCLPSVIWTQIESLPSFLHLSINAGSITAGRAPTDTSRQQTFPLPPLTLGLLLDRSPGNAHALKIVIIVPSHWITHGFVWLFRECEPSRSIHVMY